MDRKNAKQGHFVFVEQLEARQLLSVGVTIDTDARFQTIDGFGSSIAGWVHGIYDRDDWRNMFYQDLGASVLRIDLNASALLAPNGDMRTPVVLGDDLEANVAKFNYGHPRVSEYGDVAAAANGRKIDGLKIFASIGSPPHWMKGPELDANTGQPNGNLPQLVGFASGFQDTSGGSLIDTPENLRQFGRYIAASIVAFERTYGMHVDAVSLQNEPAFHEPYNSCVYTPQLLVKAIKAVRTELDKNGIDTKIMGPEDVGVGSTADPSIQQRMFRYINAIRNDPEAFAALETYALHSYAADPVLKTRSPEMWRQFWEGRTQSPTWTGVKDDGKGVWETENSGEPESWSGAMRLALNAQDALTIGNVNAWVYWQTSDNFDTVSTATLTRGAETSGDKYNAAKHFFRYIRPGSERVSATPSNPTGVYVSAYVHDQQKTLTAVLINDTNESQTIDLTTIGVNIGGFDIARLSSDSAVWTDIGPVAIVDGKATITMPALSIATLEGGTGDDSAVSGLVFNDADLDGIFDSSESPLGGRTIYADLNKDGSLTLGEPTTTTLEDGSYRLGGLTGGNYDIRQVLPAGWTPTAPDATNNLRTVSIINGQTAVSVDFGSADQSTVGLISGSLWNDADGNGVRSGNEGAVGGVRTVYLDLNNNGRRDGGEAEFNAINGQYSFYVTPGDYTLRQQTPSGWRQTSPLPGQGINVSVGAGEQKNGIDFGSTNLPGPGSIAGKLFNDVNNNGLQEPGEGGLAGWQVYLDSNANGALDSGETVGTTDGSGAYLFDDLDPLKYYQVRQVLQSGWTQSAPGGEGYATTLSGGQKITNWDFGNRFAAAVTYVSDLSAESSKNGWGPMEINRSNGESSGGDGNVLTIGGKTYANGLGVHAASEVVYNLGGAFDQFRADIGVDDEVGGAGSVVFQVWADGQMLFDSGKMTGKEGWKSVNVDVAGKQKLKLVVTDAGDGKGADHADWGDAHLLGAGTPGGGSTVYLSDLTRVSAVNGYGLFEYDRSNGDFQSGDGKIMSLNGVKYDRGLGVHANSEIVYNLDKLYSQFEAKVGVDDEVGGAGSVVFQVWADGQKLFDSGVMTGDSATQTVKVDVAGKSQLKLVVTNGGDDIGADHGDWADAKLTLAPVVTPPPLLLTQNESLAGEEVALSTLSPLSAVNGYGNYQKNATNDGRTIKLNGVTYASGLGVHANSQLVYTLNGKYQWFMADVGVDDEVGSSGSVVFQVYADDQLLFDSGRMTGNSATQAVKVDLTGKNQLKLVVSDGGNGIFADHADWAGAKLVTGDVTPPQLPDGEEVALSTLSPLSATNGYGNYQKNATNNGRTMALNGVTYASGLGVHANSQLVYSLNGKYQWFMADVGVDDEVGSAGSVVFQVYADDQLLFDSGKMTGNSATQSVKVDVTGKNQLKLVVNDSGNGIFADHADWAGAKLFTGTVTPPHPPGNTITRLTDLTPISSTNGWGPVEKNQSVGNNGAGDGKTITLNHVIYSKGLGVHANSEQIFNLGGKYSRFFSDVGLDDEVGSDGSVVFQVWANDQLLFDSGTMTGNTRTERLRLYVAGRQQLKLVVNDSGDGINGDHGDWANSYLVG